MSGCQYFFREIARNFNNLKQDVLAPCGFVVRLQSAFNSLAVSSQSLIIKLDRLPPPPSDR
jgi:hypothetical protein